jgi:hypothetical protein
MARSDCCLVEVLASMGSSSLAVFDRLDSVTLGARPLRRRYANAVTALQKVAGIDQSRK